MRTTLNIDEQIFTNLMQLTNARTKTEAVRIALSDYVRLKRKEQLIALRGKLEIEDNWQVLRSLEIQESEEYALCLSTPNPLLSPMCRR